MHLELIRDADQWTALANEWNALLKVSHNNVPFLTYEFQRAWWEYLGGGEWRQGELNIVIGHGESGELLGIAPLFVTTDTQGKRILQFIGSHEIADFLDLIVRPEDHTAFTEALLQFLVAQDSRSWERIELFNLLNSSLTFKVLEDVADKAELSFQSETLQPSPYIEIPTGFDTYVDSLNTKQAHELRRKLRRAGRNPNPISLEVVQDPATLSAALEDFFSLMSQEADKATFLKPSMRVQMEAIARAAFAGGWLQLVFLKSGETRIAGYMNFDYDNCIWAYNAGFDNAYAYLSPGWVILSEMMRWAIEHGRRIFDFMRGDEEYKYRFGGKDRFVQRVIISKQ
jgi:CelD/BcsL family acetyltransferase involved in cellulose biosynthesis